MYTVRNVTAALMLAVLCIVFSATRVLADFSKADEREVNQYQLTEKKLDQFAQANKNLIEAFQKDPGLSSRISKTEAGIKKEKDLTATAELFDKWPEVKKAIADAGMTTREYWVFQMAMIYGATGYMAQKAGGKAPESFSLKNIEFYKTHETKFMALQNDLKMLGQLMEPNSEEEELEEEEEEEVEDE